MDHILSWLFFGCFILMVKKKKAGYFLLVFLYVSAVKQSAALNSLGVENIKDIKVRQHSDAIH